MSPETVKSTQFPAKAKLSADTLSMLGIPEGEMTPAVTLAVSALLEKLNDITRELSRTKENLSEIERLVDVDVVAPIPNRRAFMRRLNWAIIMQERYGHPSSVLYFDLNDFKDINDQYGHAAGDAVIRHVSQLLSSAMRESDFLGRIGGDEFAIIMYYANGDAAQKRATRIAAQLSATPLIFNGEPLKISTAYGFHAIRKGEDAEAVLSSADTSMYVNKRLAKVQTIK